MADPSPDDIARAICREVCAFMGEPPCFALQDEQGNELPWPNTDCAEPGCMALAVAALAALNAEKGNDNGEHRNDQG